jgi:hypothetical protein
MDPRVVSHTWAGGHRRPPARDRSRRLAFRLGCLLAAATWALPSAAWAYEPPSNVRYTRSAPKLPPVQDPKVEIDGARKAVADAPQGPSNNGPQAARASAAIELAAIDDQLLLLDALLREASPADKEYPDYLFRYASLHLDRKAIFEHQAGSLYEEIHAQREAGKRAVAKQLAAKQQDLQRKARAASMAAVKAFAVLVQGRAWVG